MLSYLRECVFLYYSKNNNKKCSNILAYFQVINHFINKLTQSINCKLLITPEYEKPYKILENEFIILYKMCDISVLYQIFEKNLFIIHNL